MASREFEKGSVEWAMFKDFWKLTQAFYIPEENDRYWSELVDALDEFHEKYESVPLSKRIAIALSDTLEETRKVRK